MKKAVYLLMIMLCMAAKPCTAQVMPDSMSNGRYLLYYYCDRIEIEEDYLNNAYNILRIKNILNYSTRIDSITIYAYASPEGSPSRNSWLAEKRAAAARDFILENLPEGYRVPNVREGVIMHLYCDDAWWNGNGTMVSTYYSFGYHGNGYDVVNGEDFYSWSVYNNRVTLGNPATQYIRYVRDIQP